MTDLLKRLESIVGPEHMLTGSEAAAYAVDGKGPEFVVFPGACEEVSAVLALCHEARAAVTPWGGGTAMGLGGVPDRLRVVLGTRRLNQVLDHEPADMTSTVQAGVTLQDYQTVLGKNGQFLALDPPRDDRATLGGVLATNASGPRRLRYGTMRDQVIGLRVAQPDGTLIRAGAKVVKNVTGYDMNKLYVGSLGTLGVIVEASFRLYLLPAAERTWLGRFPGIPPACEAAGRILDSPLVPSAVELLNASAGADAARQGGPDMEPGVWLAVSVASVPRAVQAQLEEASRMAREVGATAELLLEDDAHERFWQTVRDIQPDTGGMVLKASMLPTWVGDACQHAESLAARLGVGLRIVAEAGTGVVRYYVGAPADGVADAARLAGVVEPLRTFALGARGSLVILEAPPEVKALVDVWGPVGDAFALMHELKTAFDPHGILNPGRFVGRL